MILDKFKLNGKTALVTGGNKAILARIPQGRWGETEDLMGTVVFLSSAALDYLNGSVVTVDGGWMGR